MKSVLLSIKPKYCELIANGKKTVEIRKNCPKIDTPFKCYIYCTNSDIHSALVVNSLKTTLFRCCNYKTAIPSGGKIGNGKVIGEFVCDNIQWNNASDLWITEDAEATLEGTCLTKEDMYKYLGVKSGTSRYNKKYEFYGWHISDLVIYDKPKELSEFYKPNIPKNYSDLECIKRPPQSWCYVEEQEAAE